MARYQVILTYDGAGFRGFQKQAKDRTVQDEIESALRRLGWQGDSVLAAGRTDTGVHATGQVIAFDLAWSHRAEELQRALNSNLPLDIAAREVRIAEPGFHPRYDASSRHYSYRLFCQPVRQPLLERYAWRVWPAVETGLLEQAAGYLVGMHDFGAFGSPPRAGGNTLRTVFHAGWQETAGQYGVPVLVFRIAADAFLYHMVRRLVYLQVQIAQGNLEVEAMLRHLRSPDPAVQGLAPAHGLVLEEVRYSDEERQLRKNLVTELKNRDIDYDDGSLPDSE